MIRYLDWAQTVLRIVLDDQPTRQDMTMGQLAQHLGLALEGLPDADSNAVMLCLDHVLRDLVPHGLVGYQSGGFSIGYPPEARRFRIEPLSSIWPELRSGYLAPEDEEFLSVLAMLSERPGADRADVVEVTGEEVFAALGWGWDGSRAVAIVGHLKLRCYLEARMYGGPSIFARVTYAGLVRVLDDTGKLLREAEDHLQASRMRAAGCIASVELERRLKALVGRPPEVSRRRDPSLDDYNRAAYQAGLIDQETSESISALAVIRKRCVHVLDREPEPDDVRRLIDEVERILRRYPAPRCSNSGAT